MSCRHGLALHDRAPEDFERHPIVEVRPDDRLRGARDLTPSLWIDEPDRVAGVGIDGSHHLDEFVDRHLAGRGLGDLVARGQIGCRAVRLREKAVHANLRRAGEPRLIDPQIEGPAELSRNQVRDRDRLRVLDEFVRDLATGLDALDHALHATRLDEHRRDLDVLRDVIGVDVVIGAGHGDRVASHLAQVHAVADHHGIVRQEAEDAVPQVAVRDEFGTLAVIERGAFAHRLRDLVGTSESAAEIHRLAGRDRPQEPTRTIGLLRRLEAARLLE